MVSEKKHIIERAQASERGVFLEARIWSLEEKDKEALSGAGLLEVELHNLMLYPIEYEVEAKGENIRWETQPNTNIRMSHVQSGSSVQFLQIFEVESELSQPHLIRILTNAKWPNRSRSIQNEVSLLFKTSAVSKLIYREDNFEQICSVIASDFEAANLELIEYYAKHPEDLSNMSWRRFEELIGDIFRNLSCRVELGTGRNDGGVDLRIFQRDDIGEILTLVQIKKYDPKRPIDLQPVAALSAIVDQENAQRGLFITTSRYLPVAKRFAEKEARRLVLADSGDVSKWCNEVIARLRR